MRVDILFFIDHDIADEIPWHITLSRTRELQGESVFKLLFKKVLSTCVYKGMLSGQRQAVDSAYIKSNASLDSLVEKYVLSEVESEILQDGEKFADELDENNESKEKVSAQKKKQVESHHKWKEKEYKNQPSSSEQKKDDDLDEFGNIYPPKFLSNHARTSKTDPDARISVKPGKPRQMNYSAQTSVDTIAHMITNIIANFSDKRDSQSLPQALEQTRKNLEENDLHIEEILADTGYSIGKALRYLKENKITGYIPNHGQYRNSSEGFIYNAEKNKYECQRGNKAILPFKKIATSHDGSTMKVFRSSNKYCKDCPLRAECVGKSDFKAITESTDKPLYDEMHERLKKQKAKRLKIQRSSTVEPMLGTLINFRGMKRIWTRGIENANKFMIGAAIAYNIKKYMNYAVKKVQLVAMDMIKKEHRSGMKIFSRFMNKLFSKKSII